MNMIALFPAVPELAVPELVEGSKCRQSIENNKQVTKR